MTTTSPVLFTMRGTFLPKDLEAARVLHNETAGSPQGIAAARGLGDLSHKVFTAAEVPISKAKKGELLFLDTWLSPEGLMQFFSNHEVQRQGGVMFSQRDPNVWMQARGGFSYHLPAAMGRDKRFVGVIRGKIGDPDKAIQVFNENTTRNLADGRRRGQLSHETFIKLNPPDQANAPLELIGIEYWCDLEGMVEHYTDKNAMGSLNGMFTAEPDPSVWVQAPGHWSEW